MTEKLFYQDSHMRIFTASVISCRESDKGYETVLDKTCFFPEGGGQASDTGTLNQSPVLDVKERDGIIFHYTKQPLVLGTPVTGEIAYEERFSKMQQHSGEHIVSGLIHSRFGYDNVGFHLGTEAVTLDFNGIITKEQLREIEGEANRAVVKNLDIEVTYPSKENLELIEYRSKIEIEGQVRIVTVPGYDTCACCAPHVKKTGEIGIIKLTGMQNYKGGVRISMLCGFRALEDYRTKEDNTKAIMHILSAKESVLQEAAEQKQKENDSLKLKCATLQHQLLTYKAANADTSDNAIFFEPDLDGDSARAYMNLILQKNVQFCAVFFAPQASTYRYVIGSKTTDIRGISQALNKTFNGKGGGKPEMTQGSLEATMEDITNFFRSQTCTSDS